MPMIRIGRIRAADIGAGHVHAADQRQQSTEPHLPADPAAAEGANGADEQEGDPEAERAEPVDIHAGGVEHARCGERRDDRPGVERAGPAIDSPLDEECEAEGQDEGRARAACLRDRPAG